VDFNLKGLAKAQPEIPDKLTADVENDRHAKMMEAVSQYAKPHVQKT
jgi:hypothetical protein